MQIKIKYFIMWIIIAVGVGFIFSGIVGIYIYRDSTRKYIKEINETRKQLSDAKKSIDKLRGAIESNKQSIKISRIRLGKITNDISGDISTIDESQSIVRELKKFFNSRDDKK